MIDELKKINNLSKNEVQKIRNEAINKKNDDFKEWQKK